jgi:hypothetical protein
VAQEIHRAAEDLLGVGEVAVGELGQADVRLGRELKTHATRGLRRRPGARLRLPLEEHDPQARVPLEEVEGDGAADDATADDDDVGGGGHAGRGPRPWRTVP